MDAPERHLRLLTDTIEAVNSTLDLEEVLSLVADQASPDALHADACFVYLYDERADELVLRATHGTRVEEMTQRPRMRPGEGITGWAAESRAPVTIARQAHLDPRFKNFPNLPEDEYESILAVPILARGERLEGALNVRTREPREFTDDEIELLLAIAAQVAQSIEHAKLYAEAQRRVHELEALARISEAVSESLYLEESLEAIVKTTMDALVGDRRGARARGRLDRLARRAARTRTRSASRCAGAAGQIGELVADRATPFTAARPRAARLDRAAGGRRARARPRGDARRARPGDPPPRQEQPADRGVAAAPAGAAAAGRSTRARRSRTRSTASSRSPPCTRC